MHIAAPLEKLGVGLLGLVMLVCIGEKGSELLNTFQSLASPEVSVDISCTHRSLTVPARLVLASPAHWASSTPQKSEIEIKNRNLACSSKSFAHAGKEHRDSLSEENVGTLPSNLVTLSAGSAATSIGLGTGMGEVAPALRRERESYTFPAT